MTHLLTKLVNFALSKSSSTKIQKPEHKQSKIEHVSLDIKNICVGYGYMTVCTHSEFC